MKIRTKLLTAVLATATALSCALTASALTAAPALNLQGNETAPAKVDAEGNATATLTLKASDFSTDVKGAKIVLTLDNNLTLTSATVTDTDTTNKWTVDENNSRVSGNTVTLVDVFNMTGATTKTGLELVLEFSVEDAEIGTYQVTVSGDFADETADQVYKSNGTGNLVINRAEANPQSLSALNEMTKDPGYFIPYGGASVNGESLTKNEDGTFDMGVLTGDISVLKCKLPAEGKDVTTFAISPHKTDKNSIQFGSYVPNTTSPTYGTFVIIGDYEAFKAAKANGLTDEEVLKKFGDLYKTSIEEAVGKTENNYMKISYDTGYILVGRKTQSRFMWKGVQDEKTPLQYALRMTQIDNADKDKTFTAVGYSRTADGTYNFSAEMQSTTLSKLYN